MTGDGALVGGGFVVTALGLVGAVVGNVGGVEFSLDGGWPAVAIGGAVVALLGLAWAAVRVSRDGLRVRVIHTLDAPTRRIIDTASARIERLSDDDPPPAA